MSTVAQRKSAQLGMSFGAARNQLHKKLLYRLATRLGEICCYRCGEPISLAEFTVDHKEPWYNNDPALFWDLDNISFSHARCNTPHTRPGRPSPRRGPADTWLCTECEEYLPESAFSLYRSRSGTRKYPRQQCKECRRRVQAEHGRNAI